MIYALLITVAVAVFAWILPWRDLKLWRASFILLIWLSIPLAIYLKYGYAEGLAAKQSLQAFEQEPTKARLQLLHQHLIKHLSKYPDDGLAYVLQGRLLFASGQHGAASESFAQAYEFYPEDEELWVEYATTLYFTKADDEKLNQLLKQMESIDTPPASAYSLMANIAMDNGDFNHAKTYWLALLKSGELDAQGQTAVLSILNEIGVSFEERNNL